MEMIKSNPLPYSLTAHSKYKYSLNPIIVNRVVNSKRSFKSCSCGEGRRECYVISCGINPDCLEKVFVKPFPFILQRLQEYLSIYMCIYRDMHHTECTHLRII